MSYQLPRRTDVFALGGIDEQFARFGSMPFIGDFVPGFLREFLGCFVDGQAGDFGVELKLVAFRVAAKAFVNISLQIDAEDCGGLGG